MRWLVLCLALTGVGCGSSSRDITISTHPADALVSVDGAERGKAPVVESLNLTGEHTHTITATSHGYKDQSVKLDKTFLGDTLLIELKPPTRVVTINVAPVAAMVRIDGKPVSPDLVGQISVEVPFTLDSNNEWSAHTVGAERTGWKKAEKTIHWSDSSPQYNLLLEPMRKDFTITTNPPGAQVSVNNEPMGTSPAQVKNFVFPVNPDNSQWVPQRVRLVKPGYDPVETTIAWDDGKSDYNFNLAAKTKIVKVMTNPPGAVVKIDGAELPRDDAGVPTARVAFPPLDDKGTLKTYAVLVSKKTAGSEWEPQQFTLQWDDGKTDYPITLKEILTRPVVLLRVKPVRADDGWQMTAEQVNTLAMKDVNEDPQGAQPVRLTDLPKGSFIDTLTVSPDGSQILFTTLLGATTADLRTRMQSVRTDGTGGATTFGDDKSLDLDPAFTPDGSQIVFSSNRAGKRLSVWQMSADGEPGLTQLTSGEEESDLWPCIDSDPKPRLFYEALPDNRSDPRLFMTQLGATSRTDLTRAGGMQPRISPKGDAILFTLRNERTGKREICKMLDRGGAPVTLTHSGADEFDPAWSKDGNKIAFVSDRGVDAEGRNNYDIWVLDLAHPEQPVQITKNGSWDDCPAWDPSGKFIYFRSNRGGQWAIWKIPAK